MKCEPGRPQRSAWTGDPRLYSERRTLTAPPSCASFTDSYGPTKRGAVHGGCVVVPYLGQSQAPL